MKPPEKSPVPGTRAVTDRWALVTLGGLAGLLILAGCVSPPEHCRGCLAALLDGGFPDAPVLTDGAGTGGSIAGSGGAIGTGGGIVATGGATGTGGVAGAGVAGTGAAGRAAGGGGGGVGTGGRGTGGATGTGGRGTGGAATGGRGTGGAATGGMGTGGATTDQGLVLRYTFDESGGNVANDSSGFTGGPRNGTLMSAGIGALPTFAVVAPLVVGSHYLNLTGTSNVDGGYVVAPNLQVLQTLTPGAMTIAAWVFVATDRIWQRIFDFGLAPATGNPAIYMYLTTHHADTTRPPDAVRFSITTGGSAAQQPISTGGLLAVGAWHHVAVVLPAGATYTGTLYVDGFMAGTNPAMTLHPTGLVGAGTPYGYIGRSGVSGDPYFSGRFDDFRVYNRALTAAEVAALFILR